MSKSSISPRGGVWIVWFVVLSLYIMPLTSDNGPEFISWVVSSSMVCSPSPMTTTSKSLRNASGWVVGSAPPATRYWQWGFRRFASSVDLSRMEYMDWIPIMVGWWAMIFWMACFWDRNVQSTISTEMPFCFRYAAMYPKPRGGNLKIEVSALGWKYG